MHAPSNASSEALNASRRVLRATILIGIGLMAAVDEIVFHQILGWHHFYDQATPQIALLSDGLLHAGELLALVAGFFLWAEARRSASRSAAHARAGLLLGAGSFQLFDGLVDHKLLRLHQIRYDVDLLPYDVAWNSAAVVLLTAGFLFLRHARRHEPPAGVPTTTPA